MSPEPLSSMADMGRLPDALENDAGADRGDAGNCAAFMGNVNAGRGVGREVVLVGIGTPS